jgi:hypothetical protein
LRHRDTGKLPFNRAAREAPPFVHKLLGVLRTRGDCFVLRWNRQVGCKRTAMYCRG